ncbi:MAG: hypothetical protein AB8B80_13890 [Marinicellaceae bacterium]
MNKTLSIEIHQDPTEHVEQFLQGWLQFGAYEQVSEVDFDLFGRTGKTSRMSMTQFKITITGDIPSETFMLIDKLSKDCESDKIIEGEFIDKDSKHNPQFNNTFQNNPNASFQVPFGVRQFGKITALSKTKMVLVLLISIPILIILIPIAIVVMIIKIIMFKLNFK